MNILSIYFHTSYNQLAKETQGNCPPGSSSSLKSLINLHFSFLTSISFLNSFYNETEYSVVTPLLEYFSTNPFQCFKILPSFGATEWSLIYLSYHTSWMNSFACLIEIWDCVSNSACMIGNHTMPS